jgi:predicted DsbA family dithiol-disulfide isomerase
MPIPAPKKIKIDFVSDVVCPWCAIGLQSLLQALDRVKDVAEVEIHFQPFELHPDMAREGKDINEYLGAKYGMSAQQLEASRETIRARGADVGFHFNMDKRSRTYNTLDAHRLLHWAGPQGKQMQLKKALLQAYFTDGENPSDKAVLVRLAGEAGLDITEASTLLESDRFAAEVRAQERYYQSQGINSVPAVVINDRHLISGGQPPEVFEQALRKIAAG